MKIKEWFKNFKEKIKQLGLDKAQLLKKQHDLKDDFKRKHPVYVYGSRVLAILIAVAFCISFTVTACRSAKEKPVSASASVAQIQTLNTSSSEEVSTVDTYSETITFQVPLRYTAAFFYEDGSVSSDYSTYLISPVFYLNLATGFLEGVRAYNDDQSFRIATDGGYTSLPHTIIGCVDEVYTQRVLLGISLVSPQHLAPATRLQRVYAYFPDPAGFQDYIPETFSIFIQYESMPVIEYVVSLAYQQVPELWRINAAYPYAYDEDIISESAAFSLFDYGHNIGLDEGYNEGYGSGSQEGYAQGYLDGNKDGYLDGREAGYNVGYNEGISQTLADVTPWTIIVDGVNRFFLLEPFGSGITLGNVLSVGFGALLLGFAIKIFLGG